MKRHTSDVTADDQIDLWQRLHDLKPETLHAVEDIARRLPPAQRQALWELLAAIYKRARNQLPMPHDIWKVLTPEQRALLPEEARPDEDDDSTP
jgi:hypothetical protein